MASVYNFTDGSISGAPKPHDTTPRGFQPFILRNIVDTALQNIANDGSSAGVISVPAGVTVMACWIRIITVDAGGGTLSLGVTTTDATKWGSSLSLATGGVVEHADAFLPLYFSSADKIDVLEDAAAAITTAKFEVIALCINSDPTIDAEG